MHNNRVKVQYSYDDFYRSSRTVLLNTGYALDTAYSWRPGTDSSHTSFMPSGQTETLKDPDSNTVATTSLSYTYDVLGNIETVSEGGVQKQRYWYDSLNQLAREDNLDLNKTIVYNYDLGGNLTSTEEYAYQTGDTVTGTPTTTNSYTYGDSNWKDKLTAYNGNTITYDQIGNPLSYHNGFTFTWQKGRQLASATNGTDTVIYAYNSDGYRISKTVNGTAVSYTLEGDQVRYEKYGSVHLWYYYDAAGAPAAFSMGNNPVLYLYRKNLQGDITGIYSSTTGALLVSYVYDAWGKVTKTDVVQTSESAEVLNYNPYLYRGYRYDAETGLYYLNSRYYDPETGRFINADSLLDFNHGNRGTNIFAYAVNNPQSYKDKAGTDAILINDYGEEGLPVFGHARLFIQDGEGNWYFTEFAGENMRDATVRIYPVDETNDNNIYELLQSVINNEYRLLQKYVYIEGDFSESVKYAKEQNGTDFNRYKPITNNCVKYARKVLSKGNAKSTIVNKAIRNTKTITAAPYVSKITAAVNLSNGVKKNKLLIVHMLF